MSSPRRAAPRPSPSTTPGPRANPNAPFDKWLLIRIFKPNGSVAQFGSANTNSSSTSTTVGEVGGVYVMQVFSRTPAPGTGLDPVVGAQVPGSYAIRNLRGLNGAIVLGTGGIPEPGTLALLGTGLLAVGAVRARQRGQMRRRE